MFVNKLNFINMRKYNWDEILLKESVKKANCWFNWLELLGVPKKGNNYRTLKNKAKLYEIDTSHFNYAYAHTHNGKHSIKLLKNKSNREIFTYNLNIKKGSVKKEYIKRYLKGKPICEICKIRNWQGNILTFQLHHKDGDMYNHHKYNLQLLCPNCHSQTVNYRGKSRRINKITN